MKFTRVTMPADLTATMKIWTPPQKRKMKMNMVTILRIKILHTDFFTNFGFSQEEYGVMM